MLSNKIISVSIVCIALILSVWLFTKNQTSSLSTTQNNTIETETVMARPYIETVGEDDWKKVLTKIDQKNQTFTDLTKSKADAFDETTLTAQIARDFLSQYLLAKKGGTDLTQEQINKISQDITSLPKYTKITAAVYVYSNLHIDQKTDTETLRNYKNNVNLSLKTWTSQIKDDPVSIVNDLMKSKDEKILSRFDPLIAIAKGLVNDFLSMSVPQTAVNVHLSLLNSFSNILSDLESMRVASSDPAKSLIAISQYNNHKTEFFTALKNMNVFISKY